MEENIHSKGVEVKCTQQHTLGFMVSICGECKQNYPTYLECFAIVRN